MNMENYPLCEDHPDQKLIFVCMKCDKLICPYCKMADHEGHTTADVHKVAADAQRELSKTKQALEDSILLVRSQIRELEDFQKQPQVALQDAEEIIERKTAIIVAWVNEARDKKLECIRKMAQEKSWNGENLQKDLQEQLQRLNDLAEQATNALNDGDLQQNMHKFISAHLLTKQHKPKSGNAANVKPLNLPNYVTQIVLENDETIDCQNAVDKFLGVPFLAEVSDEYPTVTVYERFRCSHDPRARVMCVSPMADGTLVVVYSTSGVTARVGLFTSYGQKLKEEEAYVQDGVKVVPMTSNWVALVSLNTRKLIDFRRSLSTVNANDNDQEDKTVYQRTSSPTYTLQVSKSRPGAYSICDTGAGIYKPDMAPKPEFDVIVQNPTSVVADSKRQYFAVIAKDGGVDQNSSGSTNQKICSVVAVFQRPKADAVGVYKGQNNHSFSPCDVCFLVMDGAEMLLVADTSSDSIHIVNYQVRCNFVGYLGKECSLIKGPTAIAAESSGRLWIGCKDGRILTCLSSKEFSLYEVPELPKVHLEKMPPDLDKKTNKDDCPIPNQVKSESILNSLESKTSKTTQNVYHSWLGKTPSPQSPVQTNKSQPQAKPRPHMYEEVLPVDQPVTKASQDLVVPPGNNDTSRTAATRPYSTADRLSPDETRSQDSPPARPPKTFVTSDPMAPVMRPKEPPLLVPRSKVMSLPLSREEKPVIKKKSDESTKM